MVMDLILTKRVINGGSSLVVFGEKK